MFTWKSDNGSIFRTEKDRWQIAVFHADFDKYHINCYTEAEAWHPIVPSPWNQLRNNLVTSLQLGEEMLVARKLNCIPPSE